MGGVVNIQNRAEDGKEKGELLNCVYIS